MDTFDYTISSMDCNHNNRIYTNIAAPQTEYCKMTITSLTTIANFVLLNTSDYITINDITYKIDDDFSDVNTASLVEYLNGIIDLQSPSNDISVYYDSCSRIYFTSKSTITINDCSYNLKLMLGLVNVSLPLESGDVRGDLYTILCPDVGLYLSTPVLYLACNLGSNSYKNTTQTNFTSMRILMRLTNSFFAKQPINHANGDYTTMVRCSDLSDVRFTLIDANYHEVKLLSPMYLTIQIEAIPDSPDKQYNIPENIQSTLQMTEFAYLRDLTERGRDYDLNTISDYIYFEQQNQQQNEPKNVEKQQSDSTPSQ